MQQDNRVEDEGEIEHVKPSHSFLDRVIAYWQNKEPVGDSSTVPQELVDRLESLSQDDLKVWE